MCKVKWFLDFQEACAHEKNCNGSANNIGVPPPPPPSSSSSHMAHCDVIEIVEETTSLIPTDSNDGTGLVEKANSGGGRQTLASIFRPQRGVSSTTKEQSKMTKKLAFTSISSSSSSLSSSLPRAKMKKNKEATTSEVVPGITQAEYEEHLAAEKEHRRRTTRTSTRLAAIDEESTKNVQALKSTSNKRARLGRREERRDGRTNAVKMEVDDNSTDDDEADDECKVIDAVQPTTTSTKSNTVTKKKGLL